MAKNTTRYECQSCGAVFPVWQGRCTECGEWNAVSEQIVQANRPEQVGFDPNNQPIALADVLPHATQHIPTGIGEFDRLLGSGLVCGSVSLLGGEPGIGKSTLSLQMAQKLALQGLQVLYVSGEESVSQLYLRSIRLEKNAPSLYVISETNMAAILQVMHQKSPDIVILDSIQVVFHPDLQAVDGSVSQVRYCANLLIQWIKKHNKVGIIIGHITKEGSIAGPKVLEHMVDVILYLEGERNQKYRILRSYKNRFFNTHDIGVFEMKETGLAEVLQPSELFVDEATLTNPGSVVAPVCEGDRAFLVEVQALVVSSGYGMPKRNMVGVNPHRAHLLIAMLEKLCGLKLSSTDIFLTIIGGLKVDEPALDLAIIGAIMSSYFDKAIGQKIGIFGEVGLSGEIRSVPNASKRLLELKKMGFSGCILPEKTLVPSKKNDIKQQAVNHVRTLFEFFGSGNDHRPPSGRREPMGRHPRAEAFG